MAITGSPRKFHKKFKFILEFDGIVYGGFAKCSELSYEIGEVAQREGGTLLAEKDPGLVTIPNVTLERGATTDLSFWDWCKQVVDITSQLGDVDENYKKNFDLVQQDRDGTTLLRWRCYRSWPRKFVAGEWDNSADENVIEKVELVLHNFEPILPQSSTVG